MGYVTLSRGRMSKMSKSETRELYSLLQVRTASCAGSACLNSFGDEQLAVDLLADKLLFEALKFSVSPLSLCHGLLQAMTQTGSSHIS